MRRQTILAGTVGLMIGASGAWVGHGLAMSDHDHGDHGHDDHGHDDHGMSTEVPEDAAPSTRAFIEANDRMHDGMMIDFTGDADTDFVRGMIPHHEGAIAMAEIVLEYGEDESIADLAREIIDAQEAEIDWMQDWLAEHAD